LLHPVFGCLAVTFGVSLCLMLFIERLGDESVRYVGDGGEFASVEEVAVFVVEELEFGEGIEDESACLGSGCRFAGNGEEGVVQGDCCFIGYTLYIYI